MIESIVIDEFKGYQILLRTIGLDLKLIEFFKFQDVSMYNVQIINGANNDLAI